MIVMILGVLDLEGFDLEKGQRMFFFLSEVIKGEIAFNEMRKNLQEFAFRSLLQHSCNKGQHGGGGFINLA